MHGVGVIFNEIKWRTFLENSGFIVNGENDCLSYRNSFENFYRLKRKGNSLEILELFDDIWHLQYQVNFRSRSSVGRKITNKHPNTLLFRFLGIGKPMTFITIKTYTNKLWQQLNQSFSLCKISSSIERDFKSFKSHNNSGKKTAWNDRNYFYYSIRFAKKSSIII